MNELTPRNSERACSARRWPCILAALLTIPTSVVVAAERTFPEIKQYGGIHPTPRAAERPTDELRYRVLFDITDAAKSPQEVHPGLEKVARLVNLLAQDGVRPVRGDVVAIVHGEATPVVLSHAAFAERHGGKDNPNPRLIARLREAGVSVRVCSQALAHRGIDVSSVDESVQVDVAAITTLANLQLRGYALIPD